MTISYRILVVFNKVKLLSLSTNLPCSKYFVDGIGQNTISVEKFNLDFTDDVIFTGLGNTASSTEPFWYADGGAYDNYVNSLILLM